LHLPFQIVRTDPSPPAGDWHDAFSHPGVHHPPHGRPQALRGSLFGPQPQSMAEFDDWLRHGSNPKPPPEPEKPDDHALSWMAVIEDRLADMYGARVYATRAALSASHPPDTRYANPHAVPFPIP
jgi:hypothetical protein